MKLHAFVLISLVGFIAAAPNASAQSFKDRLKGAVKRVKQEVKQDVKQEVVKQVTKNNPKIKSVTTSTSKGNLPAVINNTSSSPFGANHTALFAPVGKPVDAKWGTKTVTPVKPPKEDVKQPDWNDSRTYVYELDNKSLVDEFLMLDKCMETKYINPTGPASFRYHNVLDELVERTKVLNTIVEYYNEANDLANDDENSAFADEYVKHILGLLRRDSYKRMIRSSLASFSTLNKVSGKNFINDETLTYFKAHGGFENAHKAKFTVIKEPQR